MKRFVPEVEALRRGVDRPLKHAAAAAETLERGMRQAARGAAALTWQDLRAVVRRNSRHGMMMLVAATLMAPSALAIATREAAPVEVEAMAASEVAPASEVALAPAQPTVTGAAWAERALERERAALTERLAREFSISKDLAERIHEAAGEHDIEPEVAFGLVRAESSFRRTVVSHAGAVGLTQLLPSTARWIEPGTKRADLFDVDTNLKVGFRYLRYLIDKYDGNVDLALTAYNRGPGAVDRLLRSGRNPDNGYVAKVYTGKASQKLIRQNSARRR